MIEFLYKPPENYPTTGQVTKLSKSPAINWNYPKTPKKIRKYENLKINQKREINPKTRYSSSNNKQPDPKSGGYRIISGIVTRLAPLVEGDFYIDI